MQGPPTAMSETVRQELAGIVGDKYALTKSQDMQPYFTEGNERFDSQAEMVLRPGSTGEVAAIVKACGAASVPIVPQGGNTNFVGGTIANGGVVVNMGRLNRVREVDGLNFTMTAEAGCVLADLQTAAAEHERLFPLSLGAQGSCMIGGNLSTNAGGVGVLRYGNTRDLTLGLEVVLPNGDVWNGLRGLRKDNTGYDLKHLFIGGEGTLGIITAATLKLFPLPAHFHTAFVGVEEIGAAIEIFGLMRQAGGDQLTAFELMSKAGVECFETHLGAPGNPLSATYPYYLLVEMSDHSADGAAAGAFESGLSEALERGLAQDVVITQSRQQYLELWHMRHDLPMTYPKDGAVFGNDVSVPVSQIPALFERVLPAVEAACPGIRPVPFGHIGDGNIHFSLLQPVGMAPADYLVRRPEIAKIVTDIARDLNGSFSAEHGIGLFKRETFTSWKSPVEVEMMRALKTAIDPHNLMNPGKIFADL